MPFAETCSSEAREREHKGSLFEGYLGFTTFADNFGNGFSSFFAMQLREDDIRDGDAATHRPNLTPARNATSTASDLGVEDLFHHVLATLHDPAYREANAGALRMEWPRIPVPGWPDGGDRDAARQTRAVGGARARTRRTARSRQPGSGRNANAAQAGNCPPLPSPPRSAGATWRAVILR